MSGFKGNTTLHINSTVEPGHLCNTATSVIQTHTVVPKSLYKLDLIMQPTCLLWSQLFSSNDCSIEVTV